MTAYCHKWSVVHKIGHAIGLWHEHTRLDRDRWVIVHWDNIKAYAKSEFKVNLPIFRRDICSYDYDSIMHYPMFAFSKVKGVLPTLTPKVANAEIGQRDHLSTTDKKVIDFMYGSYRLRAELLKMGKKPASGIRQVLSHGGSIREWMIYSRFFSFLQLDNMGGE